MPERNDWYYWSKNRHAHFIVFRDSDDRVATGIVKSAVIEIDEHSHSVAVWRVNGPCWSTYEKTGTADSLDEAKKAVDEQVMAIIEEEFKPEYIPPLG